MKSFGLLMLVTVCVPPLCVAQPMLFDLAMDDTNAARLLQRYPQAKIHGYNRYANGTVYTLPVRDLPQEHRLTQFHPIEVKAIFDQNDHLVALLCVFADRAKFGELERWLSEQYPRFKRDDDRTEAHMATFRAHQTRILLQSAPGKKLLFLSYVTDAFFSQVEAYKAQQRSRLEQQDFAQP